MKYSFYILLFYLVSCKGQDIVNFIEVKSDNYSQIEIQKQKNNSDSLAVIFSIPKSYLISTNKNIKPIHLTYYKDLNNNEKSGHIEKNDSINIKDTIDVNIKYLYLINFKDFNELTNQKFSNENSFYKIINNKKLYDLLKEYKNDEIVFKYYYLDNPQEIQVLSASVNLE
ncbi:hypothetical protein [Moheibacter stercoris]|uniref:Lipoprotein n=1 Tax=Moheibacter stercoris TaxID=1628251 RepID=A0ABV2LPG6_9FLAO